MNKSILYLVTCLFVIICLGFIWALSNFKMHNFEGKCQLCHITIPGENQSAANLTLVDELEQKCGTCHQLNKQKSHPIKIKPNKDMPLTAHLDKDGFITCTTCHDVHKEDTASAKSEGGGLLWGHVKGRAFCSLCHKEETLNANWQHQSAIPYAHSLGGKFSQVSEDALLDKFSVECLSCHDGTLSKSPQVEVKQGVWKHGIGMSHPIGAAYPRSMDYTPAESLPEEIPLFDGRIGCLSCHEIYNPKDRMLAMDNNKSNLCLTCHNK